MGEEMQITLPLQRCKRAGPRNVEGQQCLGRLKHNACKAAGKRMWPVLGTKRIAVLLGLGLWSREEGLMRLPVWEEARMWKGSINWLAHLEFSSWPKCREWVTVEEGARLGLGRPVRRWSSNPGERGWSPDLRWWLRDWEKKMVSFR